MVNFSGLFIESNEIIGFLKQEMLLKEVCQKILYQTIIERTALEKEIAVTPEEIQSEADKIRHTKRLEKASDTLSWLEDQAISADDWEAGICSQLLSKKLAAHLFNEEVEKYFAQHRLDFEQLLLYQIIVPYEQLAQELFYQIEEEEISFYQAAHCYDIDERRRYQCGYEGKIYRWSLNPAIAAAVFSAALGEIVGPLQTEQGYHLLMVEESIQADLTTERRQEIINKLFKEWLEREYNYIVYHQ